ncbi:MAG: pentapeptide repeat-containing protein [Planctomycetales bacterium]|nr:pentapeptide repeat-containing protein [Planctomycetales bacterium]
MPPAKSLPIAPELVDDAKFAELEIGACLAGEQYAQVRLHGGVSTAARTADVEFHETVFEKVVMPRSQWPGLVLCDARVALCDLSNADLRDARLQRVEIVSSRLTGTSFCYAKLSNVLFRQCKLTLSVFQNADFKTCVLQDCDLVDADLCGTDLRGVRFENCDLRGSRLFGAKLTDADLRGSNLEGLGVDAADIRGAIVEAAQLLQLAPLFGLTVE